MKGVAEYIASVIGGIVAVVVVANMLQPAIEAGNATGISILSPLIMGTVLGAGLILFVVRTFIV